MIIDGKKIADEILERVRQEVLLLPFKPVFCDILVGDDPASAQYVRMKAKTAEQVGMVFRPANYPSSITTEGLISEIKKISAEPHISGLIVQLPLQEPIDKNAVLDAIEPIIDVDATGSQNTNLFYSGAPYMIYPTAAAIMEILARVGKDWSGKNILVLGRGQLVGRPIDFLLKQRGFNVSVAHSQTQNTQELLQQADLIISAVGKPKFITGRQLKPGVVVIDAGTSESEGALAGDVDFESVKDVAEVVSPVPGGVGPVTVAKLLENVLIAAKQKYKI